MNNTNIFDFMKSITNFFQYVGNWINEHLYIALPVLTITIVGLILIKLFR